MKSCDFINCNHYNYKNRYVIKHCQATDVAMHASTIQSLYIYNYLHGKLRYNTILRQLLFEHDCRGCWDGIYVHRQIFAQRIFVLKGTCIRRMFWVEYANI